MSQPPEPNAPVPPVPVDQQPPAQDSCKAACVSFNTTFLVWIAVCSLSFLGLLDTFPLHLKLFPVCLAVETAFLTSVYFWSKSFELKISELGVRKLSTLHVARIGTGLLLLFFGYSNQLPLNFVAAAGSTELFTGLYCVFVVSRLVDSNRGSYLVFHSVGLVSMVATVACGVFALLQVDKGTGSAAFPVLGLVPLIFATHVWCLIEMKKKVRVE